MELQLKVFILHQWLLIRQLRVRYLRHIIQMSITFYFTDTNCRYSRRGLHIKTVRRSGRLFWYLISYVMVRNVAGEAQRTVSDAWHLGSLWAWLCSV